MSKLLSTDFTSKPQDLSLKARRVLELRDKVFAHWEARVPQSIAAGHGGKRARTTCRVPESHDVIISTEEGKAL